MANRSPWLAAVALVAACTHPGLAGAETWVAPDPGLLRDANFDAALRGERPGWGRSQHAGEPSSEVRFEPGMLRIERTGPEPWGQVRQRLDATGWVGSTLEFSAELSSTLQSSGNSPVNGTGLGVRVMGYRPGMPRVAGKSILLTADGEPELGPQHHPWTRQSVHFRVPEGATDIDVSIRLTLHGHLAARGPSLVVVEPPPGK